MFALTVTIALVTSRGWHRGYARAGVAPLDDAVLRNLTIVTTVATYVQIILGATMRHNDAGLAIPDFPWVFGGLVPPVWSLGIALHYAHRVGALVVTLLMLATTAHVFYHHRPRRELTRTSALLLVLLALQITLGALTILTGKEYVINSLHVVTGGAVLVTSLVLTLRAHRQRFDAPGERLTEGA